MLKKLLTITLLIGIFHSALYFCVLSFASPDGNVASLQPDTALYCQAARRICEGHPFSYSAGEDLSTGTTSVLHPFVLAIPYALGFRGTFLLEAGFILNMLFYLIFLGCWTITGLRLCTNDRSKVLFPTLLAFSVQPIYCVYGQTDIGFWMATSAALVASLVYKHWRIASLVAILAPWVRPEGFIFAMALLATIPFAKEHKRNYLLIAALSTISSLCVFGFNFLLTERLQFDSVAHKGYFKNLLFPNAVSASASDLVRILYDYIFGLPQKSPCYFYVIPAIGALLFWTGLSTRKWRDAMPSGLGTTILALLGSFLVVASSGWFGINFDRYLVWTSPLIFLFIAEGTVRIAKVKAFENIKYLPVILLVVYAVFGSISGLAIAANSGKKTSAEYEFYAYCEELMAKQDAVDKANRPRSIGGVQCGSAYFLGDRRFFHLPGLYSPEFFDYFKLNTAFELLKHRADLRPTYLITGSHENSIPISKHDTILGKIIATGPGNEEALRFPDWTAFDQALTTPLTYHRENLIATLDVGYLEDEKAYDYKVIDRWRMQPHEIFLAVENLNGKLAIDAGRIIRGGDMMTIPLHPGRDCEVVLRTLASHDGIEFNSPIKMLLNVDDVDIGYVGYDLNLKTNGFQEVSFTIPGKAIRQTPSRIGFLGDHIACGYWFFQ